MNFPRKRSMEACLASSENVLLMYLFMELIPSEASPFTLRFPVLGNQISLNSVLPGVIVLQCPCTSVLLAHCIGIISPHWKLISTLRVRHTIFESQFKRRKIWNLFWWSNYPQVIQLYVENKSSKQALESEQSSSSNTWTTFVLSRQSMQFVRNIPFWFNIGVPLLSLQKYLLYERMNHVTIYPKVFKSCTTSSSNRFKFSYLLPLHFPWKSKATYLVYQ